MSDWDDTPTKEYPVGETLAQAVEYWVQLWDDQHPNVYESYRVELGT